MVGNKCKAHTIAMFFAEERIDVHNLNLRAMKGPPAPPPIPSPVPYLMARIFPNNQSSNRHSSLHLAAFI
ncbi:hypothetical protein N7478_008110 [Penicillium angulare]|uniref:uncharacterized protein n=1 Tax=Penicillium angulare TaxID=116970 RepID=UPI00254064B6|nr:uncharacterized protein N7478_008110 [Penicillium angulare]KAJ5272985.1 hypothetical protein N7478_008110 [Penicillium angulare]